MSRRPLPRPDPLALPPGSSANPCFPSRPPVSAFSETVRILNRRVKPREVKRGRVILNLKVLDQPGSAAGGGAANRRPPSSSSPRDRPASLHAHPGRPKVPSRNRIIGKNGKRLGEAPYRGLRPPLRLPGFPMYGKPYGVQQLGPGPGPPQTGAGVPSRAGDTPSSRGPMAANSDGYPPPPLSLSSSSGSDSGPPSPPPIPDEPLRPASPPPPKLSPEPPERKQNPPSAPLLPPAPSAFLSSSSSSSSPSSSSDGDEEILDLSVPHEGARRGAGRWTRRRRPSKPPPPAAGPPLLSPEPPLAPGPDESGWSPEMAPRCANVVVTDVTTNLVTVTIKEFCRPPEFDTSPPHSPATATAPPSLTPQPKQ